MHICDKTVLRCVLLVLTLPITQCVTNRTGLLEGLKNHIVSKQNTGIREMAEQGGIKYYLNIAIDFIPVAIIGLNEATQVFSFSGMLIAAWDDTDIAWNPDDFDNMRVVSISTRLMWTPTLSAANSVDKIDTSLKEEAIVFADGYIAVIYGDAFQTSCQIDTSFFPFDEQNCEVLLFPNGPYHFYAERAIVEMSEFFFSSNEWELLGITQENRSYTQKMMKLNIPINTVAVQFKLRRYKTFYLMSILAPIALLSIMNACVFLLPVESGEKVSFLVSIFVSYAMYHSFIYSSMPKSDSLSRLNLYLLLVIAQSSLSIIVTVYLLNAYHGARTQEVLKRSHKKRVIPLDVDKKQTVPDGVDGEQMTLSVNSVRNRDRLMFFVFSFAALLSLLVFVDF